MRFIYIGILLGFPILFSGCAASSKTTSLFNATGYNDSYDFKGKTFAEYIIHERRKLKLAREKAGVASSNDVIEKNAPYEVKPKVYKRGKNKPYQKAIVFIHGFTESTYSFMDLSTYFADKGFLVRTVLLPGHGSVVGDLLNVQSKDWENAVEFVVTDTMNIADEVHLSGNSTGATLALLQAYDKPQIKSLMLFSPLIKIEIILGFMGAYFAKTGQGITPLKWVFRGKESSPYKYTSLPKNGLTQPYHLTEKLEMTAIEKELTVPSIFFTVREDDVVNAKKALSFFQKYTTKNSKLTLYSNKDVSFADNRIKVVRVDLDDPQIRSFAHEALLYPDSNPTYGRHGSQKHCYGYLIGTDAYKKCNDPNLEEYNFGGSISQILGEETITRRLTFNPRYKEMLGQISAFLQSIE